MEKDSSLVLSSHFQSFLGTQIASGRYNSVSDAISAGLRLLEEQETKLDAVRRALIDGEKSGTSNYSLQALIDELDAE